VSFPQDKALDFWFKYDEFFFFHAQDTIQQAIRTVAPYGRLLNLFYYHSSRGTMNTEFKNELQGVKDSIKLLADNSKQIFDEFFKDDVQLEQSAFELYAQGLLFDDKLDENGMPRRSEGEKIHIMDSDVTGYVAWHAFVRAVGLLDLADDKDRLLQTDRHIALGAAIVAELIKSGHRPVQSDDPSNNRPIDQALLSELRTSSLNLTFEEIDNKIPELEERSISAHIL
jgi:hypothetical protein